MLSVTKTSDVTSGAVYLVFSFQPGEYTQIVLYELQSMEARSWMKKGKLVAKPISACMNLFH